MRQSWVYIDGEAVEVGSVQHDAKVYIMPDIVPYKSMADGTMITGRAMHREHLRKHNCFEVGNETMTSRAPVVKDTRREVLSAQLANMSHSQANKLMDRLRDNQRFTNNPHREK